MVTEDENYSPDYSRESKNISKEIREIAHGKHHNRLQDCNKNHDCNTLNTQVQGKQGGGGGGVCQLGVCGYSPIQFWYFRLNGMGEAGGYRIKQGAPPSYAALARTLSCA